jgi:3-methyladenine DNA glycosylase AlkD
MELDEVMAALEAAGSSERRRALAAAGNVGARRMSCDGFDGVYPGVYGADAAALAALATAHAGNAELAHALYSTGNVDAMVLACAVVEPAGLREAELERWVADAVAPLVHADALPRVVARSEGGRALAERWRLDARPHVAAAGRAALAIFETVAHTAAPIEEER